MLGAERSRVRCAGPMQLGQGTGVQVGDPVLASKGTHASATSHAERMRCWARCTGPMLHGYGTGVEVGSAVEPGLLRVVEHN